MGHILFDNKLLRPGASIELQTNTGDAVVTEKIDRLLNRNIMNTFVYDGDFGLYKFVINLEEVSSVQFIGLLYNDVSNAIQFSNIKMFNGESVTYDSAPPTAAQDFYIDNLRVDHWNLLYKLPQAYTCDKIELYFTKNLEIDLVVGGIWASSAIDIKMNNLNYSGVDKSIVKESLGGQVYATKLAVLNTLNFQIPAITQVSQGNWKKMANFSGVSQPVIIAPFTGSDGDGMFMYGRFSKYPASTQLQGQDENSQWYFKSTLNVIEER